MKKYLSVVFLLPVIFLLRAQSCFHCFESGMSFAAYFSGQVRTGLPVIVAHRMAPREGFGENALATLSYNLRHYPCTIQEIDIRMTRDKKLVLLHDDSLGRTTTGKGLLAAHTLAEVQRYLLKDARGHILEGQHIPVFRDVLAMITPQTLLMLDMKPGVASEKMMAELIKSGRERQVIVICYTLKKAQELHRKYPYLMLALGCNSEAQIAQIKKSGIAFNRLLALAPAQIQNAAFYRTIEELGIPVSFSAQGYVDTLPDALLRYPRLLEQNFGIICSDSLDKLQKAFSQHP